LLGIVTITNGGYNVNVILESYVVHSIQCDYTHMCLVVTSL